MRYEIVRYMELQEGCSNVDRSPANSLPSGHICAASFSIFYQSVFRQRCEEGTSLLRD